MRRNPPDGIMLMLPTPWRQPRVGKRRNFYAGRREHDIGLPFHGGTSQGGSGHSRRDDSPQLRQSHQLLPGQEPGPEGLKWATPQLSAAVSNASVLVEDQVAADEKVVTHFIVRGTHDRGELMGLTPNGREMTTMAIAIHRIEGGKSAEEWSIGTIGSNLRGKV
jgi:SnoaL-like polyketide cyclase